MLLMGKSTISMVMFNSYVKLPEGMWYYCESYPIWNPWCCYGNMDPINIPPMLDNVSIYIYSIHGSYMGMVNRIRGCHFA